LAIIPSLAERPWRRSGYQHGYPLKLKAGLLEQWADHVERLVQPEGVSLLALKTIRESGRTTAAL
jgi:hypothetical protein